jgi:hypothetical protein
VANGPVTQQALQVAFVGVTAEGQFTDAQSGMTAEIVLNEGRHSLTACGSVDHFVRVSRSVDVHGEASKAKR